MNYNNIIFEKAFGTAEQLDQSTLPEICFCGRSNVGKSSLINKLFGRKSLARVSSKPGKTVTINFFKCENVRFVDLPGYGYAKVPFAEKSRWSDLMEGYFQADRNIKMAFQLIDMRHAPTEFDLSMLEFLKYKNVPFTVVLTKSDKLNVSEFNSQLSSLTEELADFGDEFRIIPFSATNGKGVEDLREIIDSIANS